MGLRFFAVLVSTLSLAGCDVTDEPEAEIGAARRRAAVVAWQNVVGVDVLGNDLVKTDATADWTAGASSVPVTFAAGHVEFTTAEESAAKMVGLSHGDADQSRADIDFGLRLSASGRLSVLENGVLRARLGLYRAGDVFRIEVDGYGVRYRRNGAVLYTSTKLPVFPLLVDTSLLTPGATVDDVTLTSYGVNWQNALEVDASPGDLTKTSSTIDWTGGASSVETIDGAGSVEFTTAESNRAKMVALNHGDADHGTAELDFAIFMTAAGVVRVYENGANRGAFGPYASGDVFRIAVAGDVVTYSRNGSTFYTSSASPTFPLLVDTSLRHPGATIRNVALRPGKLAPADYIKASSSGIGDHLGDSVAMSGDTLVVAAPHEASGATGIDGDQADDSAPNAGAVYVFVRTGGTWVQQAYIKASNTEANDKFGQAIAIDGDTLVVSALNESSSAVGVNGDQTNNAAQQSGAVYVFVRSGGTWAQQAYIKASNTEAHDSFGNNGLALSGDTLVVGATGEDSSAAGVNGNQNDNSLSASGAAYVFTRSGSTWSQQAYLKSSVPHWADRFGTSAAVSGNTIAVGAAAEDTSTGAVHLFTRSGSTWTPHARLQASNASIHSDFGFDLALDEDTLVVGAKCEHTGFPTFPTLHCPGAVYVFTRSGSTWTEQAFLRASDPDPDAAAQFGGSVALYGTRLVVGAQSDNHGLTPGTTLTYSGAAYVFDRAGVTWTETRMLKALNADQDDYFGSDVTVAGDLVVVGAMAEDGPATGINGKPTSNSKDNAGAVYVFR